MALAQILCFLLLTSLTPTWLKDQVPKEGCLISTCLQTPPFPIELVPWLHALTDTRLLPSACSQLVATHS